MSAARTILFCSQSASAIGGVEEWLEQLCAGLDRSRWRPLVALVRGSKAHDPDRYRALHPRLECIEIDGRGLPQDSRVRAVARCVREVEPAIFVPLVVADAHSAAARLRAQGCASRYLLTLHGNTAPQLLHARELIPFADFGVGPGRLTTRLLARLGMPLDRLRYIANGARAPEFGQRPRSTGEPLRLGYVGRLTGGDKRVGDLAPMMRRLAEEGTPVQLSIAGDGPERERLARDLAGYPVTFLGPLPLERLYREVYPELDVLLLFSRSEAFGIALVEAMQHGVVPVCSDFRGRASEGLVEDGANGLVFPVGDAAAAAECVGRLGADPALWRRLSAEAQARVAGKFDWARCVHEWDAAFEDCLRMPPRNVPRDAPSLAGAGRGRLERLGAPPALTDAFRRARRAVFGVPAAMAGGEEWPWVPMRRSEAELEQMRRLRESADGSEAVRGDEAGVADA